MKISDLAREYSKKYIRCLIDVGVSLSSKEAYDIFRYIIHEIYDVEYNIVLPISYRVYSSCRTGLLQVKNSIEVSEKVDSKAIIEYSCIYTLVAIQYCAKNSKVRSV